MAPISYKEALLPNIESLQETRRMAEASGNAVVAEELGQRIDSVNSFGDRTVTVLAPRVGSDPGILGGSPVILGTRLPIWVLLGRMAAGEDLQTIQGDFPYVTAEDVRDALKVATNILRNYEQ